MINHIGDELIVLASEGKIVFANNAAAQADIDTEELP